MVLGDGHAHQVVEDDLLIFVSVFERPSGHLGLVQRVHRQAELSELLLEGRLIDFHIGVYTLLWQDGLWLLVVSHSEDAQKVDFGSIFELLVVEDHRLQQFSYQIVSARDRYRLLPLQLLLL